MLEKFGIVEEGRTPPAAPLDKEKQAAADLTEHVTKRAAEAAKDSINANENSGR